MKRLLLILCSLLPLLATAATPPAPAPRPKLVLMIVVDQLRTDYVDYLRPLMGSEGFNALIGKGVYMRDVVFRPARLDAVSSTAMIMTGAYPADNGVASAIEWDPEAMRTRPALQDEHTLGVNSQLTISPAPLLLSTVADELMIDGAGLSLVHSIAASPQVAVALAGHAATGATWLNTADGRWATSSYYKDLPAPAAGRNRSFPLRSRIDTMQWRPLLPIDRYPGLPAQKRQYDFRYTFPSRQKDVYELFAASPKGNEEVTTLALDYLRSLSMGRRGDAIDMLCLGYTVAPFRAVRDGDYRLELQDAYLRLDGQLGRLMKAIDSSVGLNNCVVVLCGTGYYDDAVPVDAKYRIPSGDFSTKRAIALLNGFLSAKHGPGNYVTTYAAGGFFLDTKMLENKGLNPEDTARELKDFLLKMSGVSAVYTLSDLLTPGDDAARGLRLSTFPPTAPQLTLCLTPGWNLVEDHIYPVSTTPVRLGAISTPAFVMAPGLSTRIIDTAVESTSLAPTITSLLHMRAPNGAASRPISF